MLTRDLVRAKVDGDQLKPLWLRPTPAVLDLAEAILAHWRAGVGARLSDLEEAAVPILHQSRSLPLAKGLQKLVLDACSFVEAEGAGALRIQAFDAGARLLRQAPPDPVLHAGAIAAELGRSGEELSEQLYADHPDLARLERAVDWDAPALLARYNLALAQACLLGASGMRVVVGDRDLGRRRMLLKALRFHRLMAEVRGEGGGMEGRLELHIAGPASVLEQSSRYGLQLAQFLPALATLRLWELDAEVQPPRGGAQLRLHLDAGLGLEGGTRYLSYIPPELVAWREHLQRKQPEWRIDDGEPIAAADGSLIMPDLRIVAGDRVVQIELFHRWHAAALARRLDQLAGLPGLLVGADRAVLRADPALAEHPQAARIIPFSDLPAVTAVVVAVASA